METYFPRHDENSYILSLRNQNMVAQFNRSTGELRGTGTPTRHRMEMILAVVECGGAQECPTSNISITPSAH